ncbi:hypothetical protein ACTI_78340 [Actinoplanes sp. OR16]|uniref:hypothetical protein n=1 Tax=Actinoplanes sp. OR16 TaxID=946334 RepID=UPI000F6F6901|nr:hypothetical protein [Actinoplanes sp. OR16]BBH71149.1 hypothetical protein ACTI_78340 [Actinoplanes sp. OR16]
MPMTEQTCVIVVCDTCGNGWDDDSAWHFDTAEEAETYLRGQEWTVTDEQVVCPDCAKRADCERTGHQHGPWSEPNTLNGVTYRTRFCAHCHSSDYDPPRQQLNELLHLARMVNQITEDTDSKGGQL